MEAIPKKDRLPPWISEYVPAELVESTLFRFEIQLQAIDCLVCKKCEAKYTTPVAVCPCGSNNFERQYRTITVDLLPDLDLDYEQLPQQMADVPATYAFWATVYSEAKLRVSVEERRLKAVRGKLTQAALSEGSKYNIKLTADQVKTVIESDPEITKADMKLSIAQMQCGKLYHMLEALRIKADMARSLFGMKRKELEST